MSGLYNAVFGDSTPKLPLLLSVLGPEVDVPRWRDAFIELTEDRQPILAVLTRTGGGNREAYEEQNRALQEHPLYLSDEDDDYDETYAMFRFTIDEAAQERLNAWDADVLPFIQEHAEPGKQVDLGAAWKAALDDINEGKMTPGVRAIAEQLASIIGQMEDKKDG